MCAIYVDLCDIYVDLCDICEFQLYNHICDAKQKTDQNFIYSSFATCHVESRWKSWNLMNNGSFATCQERQSAKSSLPPANKVSRQRALCHLPIKAVGKESFATCQERQSAKSSVISRRRSFPLPTAILAGGKGFADCFSLGRWQRFLCRRILCHVFFADCHV